MNTNDPEEKKRGQGRRAGDRGWEEG